MKRSELVIAFDMWGDMAFLEETRLVHVYKSSISTQSSVTTAKGHDVPYTGTCSLGNGDFPKIESAAFSAIMSVEALRLPLTILGNTDASTIRRLSTPKTRVCASTTAIGSSSAPILFVPQRW